MSRGYLSRRNILAGAAALSTAAILPRSSLADWRPTETIRVVVPAAAGGSTDVMGRLLAAHLQSAWGQNAVVERPTLLDLDGQVRAGVERRGPGRARSRREW